MFMDFLMGGPQAAEAAAQVARALSEEPQRELQAQVSTRDGRTVREYTLVIEEKVLEFGGGTGGGRGPTTGPYRARRCAYGRAKSCGFG
jgi:hypothetical protein